MCPARRPAGPTSSTSEACAGLDPRSVADRPQPVPPAAPMDPSETARRPGGPVARRRAGPEETDMQASSARTRGFTAVEVTIVIAILGLLAAVAIPQLAARHRQDQTAT